MEVLGEKKEPRERKVEAQREKEAGNAAYKKDFETAIQHYTKAMKLDDGDISFLTNMAVVYPEMGKIITLSASYFSRLKFLFSLA